MMDEIADENWRRSNAPGAEASDDPTMDGLLGIIERMRAEESRGGTAANPERLALERVVNEIKDLRAYGSLVREKLKELL